MQLELHYIALCDELSDADAATEERLPVTVEKLSGIFGCTERNAKFILRKMEEQGWIAWHPGRGRGRTSSISLREDREAMLQRVAERLADQGDVRDALKLVQQRSRHPEAEERFAEWLTDFFGFRRDVKQERPSDTLRVPYREHIGTLDPAGIYFVGESHLCRQIYDTLVKYDEEKEDVVPRIAFHWEPDESFRKWTFYLRKGVWFHHKRELDAWDVAFTFDRLRDRPNYRMIESVEADCPYVVKFTLREPCVWFPRIVGFDSTSILPRELVEEQGDSFFRMPVGTGPFMLAKRTDRLIALDAFPSYFLGRAHLDRVELHLLSAEQDVVQSLQVDLIDKTMEGVPNASAFARLRSNTGTCCRMLTVNMRKLGPHRHPAFRQALAELIDRKEMLRLVGDDRLSPAYGFPSLPDAAPPRAPDPDPDRIRRLLELSGYAGEPLFLDSNKIRTKETLILCEMAAAYGIRLVPRLFNSGEYQAFVNNDAGHIVYYNAVAEDGEVTYVDFVYSPCSAIGMQLLGDDIRSGAEAIVRSMFKEPTAEGRWRWVSRLSDLLRESYAVIFLFHAETDSYFHPRIGGVAHNTLGMTDYRQLWFKM